jgi:hypothetical protein
MGKYLNTETNRVCGSGGSNRVTIPASPYQIRCGTGTGGATSVPCKRAILSCPSGSSNVKVTIGTACTATTGIKVPEQGLANENTMYTPWIPIEDLNLLYVIGEAENDVVDIFYIK